MIEPVEINRGGVNLRFPDFSQPISHTFPTDGSTVDTWTATDDCWIVGILCTLASSGRNTSYIATGSGYYLAYAEAGSTSAGHHDVYIGINIPVQKGTVIKVRNNAYSLRAFKMKE